MREGGKEIVRSDQRTEWFGWAGEIQAGHKRVMIGELPIGGRPDATKRASSSVAGLRMSDRKGGNWSGHLLLDDDPIESAEVNLCRSKA